MPSRRVHGAPGGGVGDELVRPGAVFDGLGLEGDVLFISFHNRHSSRSPGRPRSWVRVFETPLTAAVVQGRKTSSRDTTLVQPAVTRRPSAASIKARTDNGVGRTALLEAAAGAASLWFRRSTSGTVIRPAHHTASQRPAASEMTSRALFSLHRLWGKQFTYCSLFYPPPNPLSSYFSRADRRKTAAFLPPMPCRRADIMVC